MVAAIEQGYPQREIADAAYRFQQEIDAGERVIVGVNRYPKEDERPSLPILRIDPRARAQADRPRAGRARRARRRGCRDGARRAHGTPPRLTRNLMEPLLECARAHASEGEIVQSLQQVFGTYTETPVF